MNSYENPPLKGLMYSYEGPPLKWLMYSYEGPPVKGLIGKFMFHQLISPLPRNRAGKEYMIVHAMSTIFCTLSQNHH